MGERMIILTPEFGESNTAPAFYWLNSWSNHAAATKAITEAAESGKRGSFLTPQGMMYVSPA